MLYASLVQAEVVEKSRRRKEMKTVYRLKTFGVCDTFRTTSDKIVLVLLRMIIATEMIMRSTKSRWTLRLIPTIRVWFEGKHRESNYTLPSCVRYPGVVTASMYVGLDDSQNWPG